MSDSWQAGIKEGYQTKIVQVGSCTVRIHRPILDEQERSRREAKVKDALMGFVKKGT